MKPLYPNGLIKTAAAELISVYVMQELSLLLADVANMLASDLDLPEEIAQQVINLRFKQAIVGLPDSQINADSAAVFYRLDVPAPADTTNFFVTTTGKDS